jgi:light-regulated signal transduction histidine kinase (bacteriophytochrome)
MAQAVVAALQRADPDRRVDIRIADRLTADGDPGLLRALLENLLGNAWKFTAASDAAMIELAAIEGADMVFAVRDNGVGFDMAFADRLFAPFQRLHTVAEFPGTGIGLATVARIVDRHGGRIWAEAAPGKGATFFWTLPTQQGSGK